MTLNQVLQRIKTLATAHKQIKNFYYGNVVDFLAAKTTLYPSCFLQDLPGTIDPAGKQLTINFRMFLLDLVQVSADTKQNEQDVQSDTLSIAMDLIAQIDYSGYADWKIGSGIPTQFVQEEMDDMVAGITVDISIITPWDKNVCAVPANSFTFPIIDTTMKPVYDMVYTSDGSEGSTLTIPEITGKKILMLVRETFTQYEVPAFDANQSTQFLWENSDSPLVNINLGISVNPDGGERFLILYRNF
jgi:hypothetical protein